MSHLKTIIVQVTPFIQNASIVYCAETKKCAFVDPGGDIEIILEKAKQEDLIPEKILLYLWDDLLRHVGRNKIFDEKKIKTYGALAKAVEGNEHFLSKPLIEVLNKKIISNAEA